MKTAIVIPSYDRPEQLRDCLESLMYLRRMPDRIVVVDDGSSFPLDHVCWRYRPLVKYVRQANGGPASARNTGARSTDADFIAFIDDDCRPAADWLEALLEAHSGDDRRLVGGRVVNGLQDNIFSTASQNICDYLYRAQNASGGKAEFFTSNNIGCSRAAFERIGGFDEGFPLAAAEDRDFGRRWREAGGCLVYAPEATVSHHHKLDLNSFWRQQSNYGRGAKRLHEKPAGNPARRQRFQSPLFYAGLVTFPLRDGQRQALQRFGLVLLSQAAMAYGYRNEGRSRRASLAAAWRYLSTGGRTTRRMDGPAARRRAKDPQTRSS